MNKIILIGGAPSLGKSHLAHELSKRLKIPWISTDTVRDIMEETADRKKYPELFYTEGQTPEKYLTRRTPREIVRDHLKRDRIVWLGVERMIKDAYIWKSFIIEGTSILPNLVNKKFGKDKHIKPIFIINNNEDHIRKVVYTRGLWTDADKYSDSVKEKEVEWVKYFNNWIKNEAKKYKLPYIENTSKKDAIKKALKIIK
ncbi:MAG TPA: AAA family ATPase [Candidatus Paceibacterota bacterium]